MMTVTHATLGEYLLEHDPVLVLWHHLAEVVGRDDSREVSVAGLSPESATVYLVGVFEGEVVLGGFRQFLANPSGDFAAETVRALRAVGAHVCLELLEKTMTPFPGGLAPNDRAHRSRLLARIDEDDPSYFDAFDKLYNRHVDAQSVERLENVSALLLDYIRDNAAARVAA